MVTRGERDHIRHYSNTTGVVGERKREERESTSVSVSVFSYEVEQNDS